jgi:hypothetical protein
MEGLSRVSQNTIKKLESEIKRLQSALQTKDQETRALIINERKEDKNAR